MSDLIDIHPSDVAHILNVPITEQKISAGFPSPAENFGNATLDLNKELVKNPASTFYARVKGVSMIEEGINDGDLLVIDKSITPYNQCIAVCFIDGEFTLKRFQNHGDHALLIPANSDYEPIKVTAENDFVIWGVVRYVIKKV